MSPNHAPAASGTLTGMAGGLILGIFAYLFFSWGMANGLIPVPSKTAQRRGAIALLVIAVGLLALQLALVVWAQLDG